MIEGHLRIVCGTVLSQAEMAGFVVAKLFPLLTLHPHHPESLLRGRAAVPEPKGKK